MRMPGQNPPTTSNKPWLRPRRLLLSRTFLTFVLLALGVFVAWRVAQSAPSAQRSPAPVAVPIVKLATLQAESRSALVSGTGVVTPAQELSLSPQIRGQVTFVSPQLVPGARVKKGDILARLDAREYALGVEQQRSALRSAELQIEQEAALQKLASHEWQALGEGGQPSPLFSRQSQLNTARAALASGQSTLAQAELNLARTTIRAPFDAAVIRKSVDVGQVVAAGSELGYLVGTEAIWVLVSVRLGDLALLSIPGVAGGQEPSPARVVQKLAHAGSIERAGYVTRLVEQLDDRTRRAQIVVTIPDALSTEAGLPLLPGAFVRVELAGKRFDRVYAIPREAVYEGNFAWIRGPRGLERRSLDIAWGGPETVYATGGVAEGEHLVLTRLANPIDGMTVQSLAEAEAAKPNTGESGRRQPTPPKSASDERAGN